MLTDDVQTAMYAAMKARRADEAAGSGAAAGFR